MAVALRECNAASAAFSFAFHYERVYESSFWVILRCAKSKEKQTFFVCYLRWKITQDANRHGCHSHFFFVNEISKNSYTITPHVNDEFVAWRVVVVCEQPLWTGSLGRCHIRRTYVCERDADLVSLALKNKTLFYICLTSGEYVSG